MTRGLLVALVAACSSRAPAPAAPAPAPGTPDAGVVLQVAPVDASAQPAPGECGARDRKQCFAAAEKLIKLDAQSAHQGVMILRGFCQEGDERRCFEPDTPADLRAACNADGAVDACALLVGLYERGAATCPYDTACGANLARMVCVARGRDDCGVRVADAGP